MAFFGRKFIFDGVPCEDYELMMYEVGGPEDENAPFASNATVIEETVGKRWKPFFYGVKYESKLEFPIVFGANQRRIDAEKYLDRMEIDAISSWLTGKEAYCWLEIEQEDLRYMRYRCMISELELIPYGEIPWAMRATVTCDSPYSYLCPQEFQYDINGQANIVFYNESSNNGYFMPELEFTFRGSGRNLSIVNATDGNREFAFTNVPASVTTILCDNDRRVITTPGLINIYPNFNFKFLRLKRGYNTLKVTGNGTLKLRCEFPVNSGG